MNYNIQGFIKLIEDHAFVEAHEVLEDDWKTLKKLGDKKTAKFLQSLINGATSLALYKKGRSEACVKVWGALQRNKYLIDEVNISNKQEYIYTIELLEDYYKRKETLFNVA